MRGEEGRREGLVIIKGKGRKGGEGRRDRSFKTRHGNYPDSVCPCGGEGGGEKGGRSERGKLRRRRRRGGKGRDGRKKRKKRKRRSV